MKETMDKFSKISDEAVKEALKATLESTFKEVQPQIERVQATHRRTGNMDKYLLRDEKAKLVSAMTYEIGIGFKVRDDSGHQTHDGFASIYLAKGTPTMRPDNELNEVIYGNKRKKIASEAQKKALTELLEGKYGGG
jgi:hypothetical protein